jgi:uncharacterized protein YkwD
MNYIEDNSPTYEVETELLNAVNAERARFGLKALIFDNNLVQNARKHCGWMARTFNMIHSKMRFPENIAQGQEDVSDVMRSWMSSSGHRANILNPNHTRIGVSAYRGKDGRGYWVQLFQ